MFTKMVKKKSYNNKGGNYAPFGRFLMRVHLNGDIASLDEFEEIKQAQEAINKATE